MKSFREFNNRIDESNEKQNNLKIVTKALDIDCIPYETKMMRGSAVISVGEAIKITVALDGTISYKNNGETENLVFEEPKDIAYRIVDLINQEGIGSSAFGIF